MTDLTRRQFISTLAAAAVVAAADRALPAAPATQVVQPDIEPVPLKWLDSVAPAGAVVVGTVPWPRGLLAKDRALRISAKSGEAITAVAEPIAYWPDGSVKWTMHHVQTGIKSSEGFVVTAGESMTPPPMSNTQSSDAIHIDTGIIQCTFPLKPAQSQVIPAIVRGGKTMLANAQLTVQLQDGPETAKLGSFVSRIESVTLESQHALGCTIKLEGNHQSDAGRSVLPFTLRLYFTSGSDEIRIVHSFVYDLNEQKDFIRGIGLRFDVPMSDAPYDRHIRFVGDGPGLFAEAVKTVTGLRRDPGEAVRKAQIDGQPTPPIDQWNGVVSQHMDRVPAWGDFTLTQANADGFQIRKRTREGFGWIAAGAGRRSRGTGYVGSISGGVAFGMRDFWQKHPAQIDIRNAQTDTANVTLWLWSPDAPAMDLRFYHDGMGQDTFAKQNEGLDITYEDYEPGYASPFGIARTSEMKLKILPATPSREDLVTFADHLQTPPMLVCEPQRYLDAGVFASLWTLPNRSTPAKSLIEDELAFYLDQYLREIDQRSWYGFWDFGDVRHTYDADRHVWRYDVGGFAWDNSELSTDLWLWYSFLRTGRADIFRMAEAMTRHTGEVDVYHIGPRKGLGTRHGVQHWGDSSKQTRISSAIYRRPYFFITGDARVGDLMHDQITECETWLTNDVQRKLGLPPREKQTQQAAGWSAMAWGELAAAWLTEIERTQDPKLKDKLLNCMRTIGDLPHGFYTDSATMNLDTGIVTDHGGKVNIEHLTACFGLPEICAELVKTFGDQAPKFADAWAQYGLLYNASADEKRTVLGTAGKKVSMADAHSRCTAFTAWYRKDKALAQRAWHDWLDGRSVEKRRAALRTVQVEGPHVLNPVEEAKISTNGAAQYSLSTLQNLALIGDALDNLPD